MTAVWWRPLSAVGDGVVRSSPAEWAVGRERSLPVVSPVGFSEFPRVKKRDEGEFPVRKALIAL